MFLPWWPVFARQVSTPASGFNGVLFKDARFNGDGAFGVELTSDAFHWSGIDNSIMKGSTVIADVVGLHGVFQV